MIAIVYPQFHGVGGIARYLDSFLTNLPSGHPRIYLITGDEHRTNRSYPGVEIIYKPFTSNRFSLVSWSMDVRKLVVELYDQGKIKWVNFHFPPLIPGLFLPRRIPTVLTAHTTYLGMSGRFYETHYFDSQWNPISLSIKLWMEHRIFSRTKKIISLTEQGKQEVLAYGYKEPVHVIPNGVDVRIFAPNNSVIKNFDVLFSGRIERRKGSRSMVKLCRLLIAKKPNIKICIVGYGDDETYLHGALSEMSDNVTHTGKVAFSEMTGYYNRSHVYVSTSYYEGLPGTCLEAMAMQLPVVVWDFRFYKDLVIEGKTGMLAPPNDYATMVSKILDLLTDNSKATTLGLNARMLLEDKYNWAQLSDIILKVFQR